MENTCLDKNISICLFPNMYSDTVETRVFHDPAVNLDQDDVREHVTNPDLHCSLDQITVQSGKL